MLTLTVLKAWILSVMLLIEPSAPWKATYESTAEAIATDVVNGKPLFKDDDGRHTASVFISLGLFESHFKQDAEGDCTHTDPKTGMCVVGSKPHSFCAFQVNESNFAYLGVTKDSLLTDINVCTKAASKMIHKSFETCSGKDTKGEPLGAKDRLNWYAAGGRGCRPDVIKGEHRINKASWIFGHFPLSKGVAQNDVIAPFLTAGNR